MAFESLTAMFDMNLSWRPIVGLTTVFAAISGLRQEKNALKSINKSQNTNNCCYYIGRRQYA